MEGNGGPTRWGSAGEGCSSYALALEPRRFIPCTPYARPEKVLRRARQGSRAGALRKRSIMKSLATALTLVVTAIVMTSVSGTSAQADKGKGSPPPPGALPIAEIRLLLGHPVHIGDILRLAATEVDDKKADFRWRLLRRPLLSRAKVPDKNGTEASFLGDVPGVYVVELTVRLRSRSATATLSVAATPSYPLVAVNTIDVVNGPTGMTVNAQTLNFPVTSSGISQMATYFSGLLDTDLVLVSLPASAFVSNHQPCGATIAV